MENYKRVLNCKKNQKCVVSRSWQRGLTFVEYAVSAALLSASLLVAFGVLGNQVGVVINGIVTNLG